MKLTTLLLLYLFIISKGFSQAEKVSIKGRIQNIDNKPVEDVVVRIKNTDLFTFSDASGEYYLEDLVAGEHTLIISSLGYITQSKTINVSSTNSVFDISLQKDNETISLDEVIIKGKSKAEVIDESPYTVETVEVEKLKDQNLDVNQVLKTTPGINIRQAAGLGSDFEFSLNGLSGYRVRFFIDDIPVDYLGDAYKLNNYPVNLIERIDVYKGVVPVQLGADALGGAVNIITPKKYNSYVDASYSYGSFNTHRAAISSQYRNQKSGLTIRPRVFYNFSNNNYTMKNMEVYVDRKWETVNTKRFHDDYKATSVLVEAGYTHTKWADELMLGYAIADVKKDQQTDFYNNPLGEVRSETRTNTLTLKYGISNLLKNRLKLKVFTVYNKEDYLGIDTSSNRYNWLGEVSRVANDNSGEMFTEKTLFVYEQKTFVYRGFLGYELFKNHSLNVNHTGYSIKRQGENRLGKPEEEPFRNPNSIKKNITGLSYDANLLKKRLQTTVGLKHYHFNMATNIVRGPYNARVIENLDTTQSLLGYLIGGRYTVLPNLYAKASIEKGYRIPEPTEVFGDGLGIYANPELKPETSENFNLGLTYKIEVKKAHHFKPEINFFIRNVDNYIIKRPFRLGSQYENILAVFIKGYEFALDYNYKKRVQLKANVTRQYILNNEKYVRGTNKENRVYKDQLPNTPYLFGNINLNYLAIKNKKGINLSFYYRLNYVHQFFLAYESIATSAEKNIIPSQTINDIGFTLQGAKEKVSFGLECTNLFDQLAFDNFNFQKPGRAFSFKIRYLFKS